MEYGKVIKKAVDYARKKRKRKRKRIIPSVTIGSSHLRCSGPKYTKFFVSFSSHSLSLLASEMLLRAHKDTYTLCLSLQKTQRGDVNRQRKQMLSSEQRITES